MKTYYALIAEGASYTFSGGAGRGFNGVNGFMEAEAESRVEAIVKLCRRLSENHLEITALKTDFQDFMLGLTAVEVYELSKFGILNKEASPEKAGVQIQAISETPFV